MKASELTDEYLLGLGDEVVRYLLKMGVQKQDVEDILQNTFCKILVFYESIETQKLRPWMYRVALNELYDLKRFEKKQKKGFYDYFILKKEPSEAETVSDEKQQQLFLILEKIKKEYREILLLKYYFHLSYEEIARILDIQTDSVKTKLYRAREAAKKINKDVAL